MPFFVKMRINGFASGYYVIETVPEFVYCGEYAVKNISSDIPELEIELIDARIPISGNWV